MGALVAKVVVFSLKNDWRQICWSWAILCQALETRAAAVMCVASRCESTWMASSEGKRYIKSTLVTGQSSTKVGALESTSSGLVREMPMPLSRSTSCCRARYSFWDTAHAFAAPPVCEGMMGGFCPWPGTVTPWNDDSRGEYMVSRAPPRLVLGWRKLAAWRSRFQVEGLVWCSSWLFPGSELRRSRRCTINIRPREARRNLPFRDVLDLGSCDDSSTAWSCVSPFSSGAMT